MADLKEAVVDSACKRAQLKFDHQDCSNFTEYNINRALKVTNDGLRWILGMWLNKMYEGPCF